MDVPDCCKHPFFSILLINMLLFGATAAVFGQELNTHVQVDQSRLSSTSLSYLDNLPDDVESYLNEYSWTDSHFGQMEKIEVDIQIILLSVDANYNFDANIVIRSRRPIYNTLQQTTLFLYNDENWTFNYTPNRGLVHDNLQFDALTTLLDYYANVIIGYDYDSFSELGGTPYFTEAQNLVSVAQTTSNKGWSANNRINRSRVQLISDLLNPNYEAMRKAEYVYHRKGLDQFLRDPDAAREQIINALELIKESMDNTSQNLLFNTFFNAKYREIVSVFEDAPTEVRLEAYNLLSQIDQGHLTAYDKLQ